MRWRSPLHSRWLVPPLLVILCGLLLACGPARGRPAGAAKAPPAPEPAAPVPGTAPRAADPAPLLPADALASYERPVWSPDGKRLAFAEWWVDYRQPAEQRRSRARLLVIDRDGAAPRVLWDSRAERRYRRIGQIRWSADGRRLMFSEEAAPFDSDDIEYTTRLVDLEGKVDRRLPVPNCVTWDWSADGAWIAFEALQGPAEDLAAAPGLWIIRPGGSERRRVVPIQAEDEERAGPGQPAWSPDGRQLAFFFWEGEPVSRRSLRVVDREGNQWKLWEGPLEGEAFLVGPAWSPAGDRVFAAVDRTLVSARPDGAEPAQTRTVPSVLAGLSPAAGVLACFPEGDLQLVGLEGGSLRSLTRGRPFAGKLRWRLGNYPDELTAEAAIASDRAVAVTAGRGLYRFPPRAPN